MAHLIEDEDGAPYLEGVQAIAKERARQITELGYDEAHDEQYTARVLAKAAEFTLSYRRAVAFTPGLYDGWPDPSRRDLEKAGALIAAAIDRLNTGPPDG